MISMCTGRGLGAAAAYPTDFLGTWPSDLCRITLKEGPSKMLVPHGKCENHVAAFVWLALFRTTEKGNDDDAFAMVSYARETACEKDCFSRSGQGRPISLDFRWKSGPLSPP